MEQFRGFSPETIDFLWGIRFNNNREWFAAHKEEYQRTLYEPMKALSREVGAAFSHVDGMKMHLSRIYRDMRMHPPTFYKDSLWFCLRYSDGPWLEHPGLCFEIRPEGYRYGFLYAHPKAAAMEALRQRIKEAPDPFLKAVRQGEKGSGIVLQGDAYARPKPCENPIIAPYFGLKNLIAIRDCLPDDMLFSPALGEEVKKSLLAWLPLWEYLSK